MNYGRGMRRAREAAGLTVEEMAERWGVPPAIAKDAEDSAAPTGGQTLYAEALGIPVELIALLGADPEDLRGITPEAAEKLSGYLPDLMATRQREQGR